MRLYLITDDRGRSVDELVSIVSAAMRGGVSAVQFREKSATAEYCEQALPRLAAICDQYGAPLLLNADLLDRATDSQHFHGIHYSERTLRCGAPVPEAIAGYSAHRVEEIADSRKHGIDFCTYSPIFSTPSKEGILSPLGLQALKSAQAVAPDAVIVALGGVHAGNAGDCVRAGANGVAVMSAVMSVRDPELAARALSRAVDEALKSR